MTTGSDIGLVYSYKVVVSPVVCLPGEKNSSDMDNEIVPLKKHGLNMLLGNQVARKR